MRILIKIFMVWMSFIKRFNSNNSYFAKIWSTISLRLTRIVCELILRKVLLLYNIFIDIFLLKSGNENWGKREAYPPLINFCSISVRTVNLELIFVFFINFFLRFWINGYTEHKMKRKNYRIEIKFTSK
jgi:hypothetical protein